MAELATIARPYAEALFKAEGANPAARSDELQRLAAIASDPTLRQVADNPKVSRDEVFQLVSSVAAPQGGQPLSAHATNLLRLLLDNRRLAVLPEIAAQYHALVNSRTGTAGAVIHSAFPIEPQQLPEVVAMLEKRFDRKLEATVVVDPSLIGGIRVLVGDEVLDASVKARLEQMRISLTA
jgi:F-type H+-transporting ATPase subunit delta